MDIKDFFSALIGDWVSLMSGVASVALTIIGIARKWEKVPRWTFWIAAAVCFFLAATRIWTAEHRSFLQAEEELDNLTKPQLELSIDRIAASYAKLDVGEHAGEMFPAVSVIAHLVNNGAPSVADNWRLRTTLRDGSSQETSPIYIDPSQVVYGTQEEIGGNFRLSLSDELIFKAFNHPIERGNVVRGIIVFAITAKFPLLEVQQSGTRFDLSCTDFRGVESSTSFVFTGKPMGFNWLPGLAPIPPGPPQGKAK